jgi:ribosomal protein S18 acetylase RimI-like enzyme
MEAFERAILERSNEINDFYLRCKEALLSKGILQWGEWGDNYPNRWYIRQAIEMHELFILEIDWKLCGAVILNEDQMKEWGSIGWDNTIQRVLVIHAFAIEPEFQGKGFGKKLLLYCEQYAAARGYNGIRLDSFEKNDISNHLYKTNGYRFVGSVMFDEKPEGNKNYFCYEKKLLQLDVSIQGHKTTR